MKKCYFLFLIVFCSVTLTAQNLVPNPSFENYTNCPSGFNSFASNTVQDWISASMGTPDYHHTCANIQVGVPTNFFGYQNPRTGSAYTGCYWVQLDTFTHKEYLQAPLLSQLVAGNEYYVSFWICLADSSSMGNARGTDKMGAYFSPTALAATTPEIVLTPQIQNTTGNFVMDTMNWVKIEGTFIAAGNEQYIVLGVFANHYNTPWQSLNPASSQLGRGYYYVEDVCVFNLSAPGNVQVHDTLICNGNTAVLTGRNNMTNYLWSNGATTSSITINQVGTYWVRSLGECGQWVDTYHVHALGNVVDFSLGADTTLCFGASLVIDAYKPYYDIYMWSNGATTSSITVQQAGKYWVTVQSDCGLQSDTINVRFHPKIDAPRAIDTIICSGAGNNIQLLPNAPSGLRWFTSLIATNGAAQQPRIDGNTPGTYTFYIANTLFNCESDRVPVKVQVVTTPELNMNDTAVCEGTKLIIGTTLADVSYSWNTGATNCCIEVDKSGTYILTVKNYCKELTDTIEVILANCNNCVWLPNAFTPNADGKNDYFEVKSFCPFSNYELWIFNRWGQRVFTTRNTTLHWDGTQNGKPCDVGVYYYILKAKPSVIGAQDVLLQGDIMLIR